MEVGLIVLLLVLVGIWYGLMKPMETLASMAEDEVQVMAAQRKAENLEKLASISIDDEIVAKAQGNLERVKSIKL